MGAGRRQIKLPGSHAVCVCSCVCVLCVLVRTSKGHCGQRRRPAERPKSMKGHDIRGSPEAFQKHRSTGVKEKWRDGTGPRAGWRPPCQGI